LTPGFPASETDDRCNPPLQLLVKEWLEIGIQVDIITLEYPFTHVPYHWNDAHVWPCNGKNQKVRKILTLLKAYLFGLQGVKKLPAESQPVILSCWLGWASFVGNQLAQKTGFSHYTILMGQDVLGSNRLHLSRLSNHRVKHLIAVSEFQNDWLKKNTGHSAGHIIPWGLPRSLPFHTTVDSRQNLILGVGNLIPVKNWDKWLETLALFLPAHPEFKAMLIGEGPEKARLEQRSRKLGLSGSITFTDSLPRAEVIARMQQARILLHTADYESYGFVLTEGLVEGLKIVSTPVGIAGRLTNYLGNTPATLASGLEEALKHPPQTAQLPTMMEVANLYVNVLFPV
jgi:glycosyltransferase involved in cell wall biosynthesis